MLKVRLERLGQLVLRGFRGKEVILAKKVKGEKSERRGKRAKSETPVLKEKSALKD